MPHFIRSIVVFLILNTAVLAQNPVVTLTDCETLTGWGSAATLVTDVPEGQRAVKAAMAPDGTGFLSYNFQSTGIDISKKHSLAFWWKVEGSGLQDLKIKVRNHPLVNGMEAVYTIWAGEKPPEGWQLATVELAKPQFDTWGGEPDLTRRYITFRTVSGTSANVQLFVDHIVTVDKTFSYTAGSPTTTQTSIAAFDFDSNNEVGFTDFILFAQHFGSQNGDSNYDSIYDFDTNDQVGFSDFILFSQNFGSDGTAWQLPVFITNLTQSPLELAVGSQSATLNSATYAPGIQSLTLTIPRAQMLSRDPADTFPIPIWIQVSNLIQTRQSATSYIPQTGTARTYKQFLTASENNTEPILPDFSYSGYHYFASPIPNVTGRIFDVTAYGAVANDTLSDQIAIQRAIDEAERNNGGVVFFPAGEFLVNTNTDHNETITIRSSNIVLRGSGSRAGGTIIRQVNYMPPTDPEKLWTSPYMFKFQPLNTSDKTLAKITQDAQRETFYLTVDDVSKLSVGQWITLYMNSVSAISDFLAPYQTETTWTTMRTNGIQVREKHSIAEIDGNRIRLNEPLHASVNALHSWTVREYQHLEEVGVEDISFHGSWIEEFIHHKDPIHDGGWSLLELNRCVNSWIRRSSFVNCNRAVHMGSSSAVSVYHVTQAGNKGHSSIACSGGYGVWIGLSEDLAAHHHGPGTSSRAVGTVYWRYDMQNNQRVDAHGAQPYANLLDRVNGGILYGSGASIENFPNHMKHYVLWNFKHAGNQSHYDFWQQGNARDRFVKPIIVGFHGEPVTFNQNTLEVLESNGSKVQPESLFEAQLEHRLQSLPSWLNDLRTEWEQIKQIPLAPYTPTTF
ncbi:MAG: DUF4955 domain-containing protein [Candidatus Latescibacteria bacterium]|nr:DUF4955 domain-containing protein [Candidatus Latescibacterota bacterium]